MPTWQNFHGVGVVDKEKKRGGLVNLPMWKDFGCQHSLPEQASAEELQAHLLLPNKARWVCLSTLDKSCRVPCEEIKWRLRTPHASIRSCARDHQTGFPCSQSALKEKTQCALCFVETRSCYSYSGARERQFDESLVCNAMRYQRSHSLTRACCCR